MSVMGRIGGLFPVFLCEKSCVIMDRWAFFDVFVRKKPGNNDGIDIKNGINNVSAAIAFFCGYLFYMENNAIFAGSNE